MSQDLLTAVQEEMAQQGISSPPSMETMVNDQTVVFNDETLPVPVPGKFNATVAHQGDVIFFRLAQLPSKLKVRQDRQMAEGNTRGSRHILEGGEIYDPDQDELKGMIAELYPDVDITNHFLGPVFVGGVVTHPDHGNHDYRFGNGMIMGCAYQRNLDAEEKEERARD